MSSRAMKDRRYAVAHGCHTIEDLNARELLAAIKGGTPILGRVTSADGYGSAWFTIDLPELGPRQVLVKRYVNARMKRVEECALPVGHRVLLQCVPDPARPGKYKFRVMKESEIV